MPVYVSNHTSLPSPDGVTHVRGVIPTEVAWREVSRLIGQSGRAGRLAQAASLAAGAYFTYRGLRAVRAAVAARSRQRLHEDALDQKLQDSFPASDPPASY